MQSSIFSKRHGLNIGLYIYILTFVVTAFDRFSSEYFYISYPRIYEFVFENSRLILGCLLFFGIVIAYFKSSIRKFSFGLYWAPIILHLFLGLKLGINSNPEWYISFFGVVLLSLSMYVSGIAVRQLNDLNRFVKFCITIVLLLFFLAVYQYLMVGSENMHGNGRFFFFSSHPNGAGIVWAFSSVTMLFLILNFDLKYKIFNVLILFSCLFFLFLTGSRGAYISCASGIAMVVYFGTGKKKKDLIIYFSALVIFLFFIFSGSGHVSDFFSAQVDRGNTRSFVYADAINGFLNFPVFGLPYYSGRPSFVENLLLSYMMSAGIFGVVLCAAFYFGAFSIIRRSYLKLKANNDVVPKYFIAIFFMMTVASVFEAFQIYFVNFGAFISFFSAAYLIQYIGRIK